jgi:hypothetical protein
MACVQRCQVIYGVCLQSAQAPGLATIGVSGIVIALIGAQVASSARASCARNLGYCYQGCPSDS